MSKDTSSENGANIKLRQLFIEQLQELYGSEKKLVKVLEKMKESITTQELKDAYERHCQQTTAHKKRLESVFNSIDEEITKSKSHAMAGIVMEADEIMDEEDSCSKDVALILITQKAKHYEIACYGSLSQLAETMGFTEAAALLAQTLQEVKQTDALLTLIAESGVNQRASKEVSR